MDSIVTIFVRVCPFGQLETCECPLKYEQTCPNLPHSSRIHDNLETDLLYIDSEILLHANKCSVCTVTMLCMKWVVFKHTRITFLVTPSISFYISILISQPTLNSSSHAALLYYKLTITVSNIMEITACFLHIYFV
jgi:ferredoxin